MVRTEPKKFPDGIDPEPRFPKDKQPLHQYLADQATETPDRTAINYYGTELSYGELDDIVNRFTMYLYEKGYGKGDTLFLFL